MPNSPPMQHSTLNLALIHRVGGSAGDASWKKRWTFDFLVDGRSLAREGDRNEGDRTLQSLFG